MRKVYFFVAALSLGFLIHAQAAFGQNFPEASPPTPATIPDFNNNALDHISRKHDKIDTFEKSVRWIERGPTAFDLIATFHSLSTPDYYSKGGAFLINGQPVFVGPIDPPREGNFWKYVAGDRSRAGVIGSAVAGNMAEDFVLEKVYRYLSNREGKWRYARIVIPIIRGYNAVDHMRGGIGQERYRRSYLRCLDQLGLPHTMPQALP